MGIKGSFISISLITISAYWVGISLKPSEVGLAGLSPSSEISKTEIPGYWDPNWTLPTQEELQRAQEILGWILEDQEMGEPMEYMGNFFPSLESTRTTFSDKARTLRAIYYLSPDLAGAILISFGLGMHSTWRNILAADNSEGALTSIEPKLIGTFLLFSKE